MRATTAFLLLAMPCPAFSQASTATALGYVVHVDSGAVYLDFSEKSGASVGLPFHVYTEGEELKHPVTGAVLGRAETTVASGTIREILPAMSIGTILTANAEVKIGMRARLGQKPAPVPAPQAAATGGVPLKAPRWKGPIFDYAVKGMAVADFKGDGTLQVALSDGKSVSLYPYPPKDSKPVAQFTHPGVAPRIVSLEAADIKQAGRAQLFVSLFNGTFERFETVVLELEGGQLKQTADLPYVVRGLQEPGGKRFLAMQQLVEDNTFPFNNIYPLTFKDGKFIPAKDPVKHKRVDWIYGFTKADLGEHSPALLYLISNTNHLRVQFDKGGSWKSRDSYGQSPNRVRWHEHLLEFHPPILVGNDDSQTRVYLVRNLSMLGSLSEPFGLFNGGEVYRKSWNGVNLSDDWKADLGGYSTGMALVTEPSGVKDLAVAIVGTAGKSLLWIYDP